MRSGARGLGILAALALTLGLASAVGASQGQARYEDAKPSGVPPGFEPVDVSEDMREIEARKQREMYNSVDRDLDMRYATPERRIRASV